MGLTYFISCYFCQLIVLNLVDSRLTNHHSNCKLSVDKLKCHGNFSENIEYDSKITELRLSNLNKKTLDFNVIIEKFPNLKSVFVENSEVSVLVPPENDKNVVQELILKNLKIKRIHREFVLFFPALKILRLERNLLSELSDQFHVGTLEQLYIRNNRWNCSKDLSWALHLNDTGVVKDLMNTTCKDKLYPGKNVLLVSQYKKDMNENCTKNCHCSLEYLSQDPRTNEQYPIIMVNCSGKGFRELPNHLPLHTRILRLENNKITDLKALKTNSSFRQLWDLYLDNNTIESVSYLEGSYWLDHFRVFSLKGNKLTTLPAYALDNALMKNPNMPKAVRLFLGENPWSCDCIFTPVFQELVLQKYSFQIGDLRDVKCSYLEGDENSLKPIINLSRSSVCIVSTDFSLQEGLDLLNAVLASLIIFILGKLLYDYYHFKKSGKLPWIVSKMP